MKIVIPGGSGQIGTFLARSLTGEGHEVIVLSRNPRSRQPWKSLSWDAEQDGPALDVLNGADVVINLAGRSVNCRYNFAHRREIIDSRVRSTKAIGAALSRLSAPPRVWLQASTATIYQHRYDAPNDEFTGLLGPSSPDEPDTWKFSLDVARQWEEAMAESGSLPGVRKVILRTSLCFSPDPGGIFDVLLGLVRHGLGGRAGRGDQFISWIHETDFFNAIKWIIDHPDIEGPVNLAAPNPLPNAEFMHVLRETWGMRWGLPAEPWMVELGAIFLRTESELVLKSRRVIPGVLLRSGFPFKFPIWPEAAQELCERWRRLRQHSAS